MEFKNCTPHPVHMHLKCGKIVTFPMSGTITRCVEKISPNGTGIECAGDIIPIVGKRMGKVEDLPDSTPGTMLIVSLAVATAAPDRWDLVVPDDMVREPETKKIVGCRRFATVGYKEVKTMNANHTCPLCGKSGADFVGNFCGTPTWQCGWCGWDFEV